MTGATVWAADVVLSDGDTVHVRPIEPGDAVALQQFHARQSRESQYYRYFSAKAELTDLEATRFSTVDLRDRGALVVEDGADFVAWASYERLSGRNDADVAFHVDGGHARRGIATLLLEHLGSMAKAAGIERFTAEVLADNRPMLRVFGRSGWPIESHFESGIVDFVWPIDETAAFLASVSQREQLADSRSMARFLLPKSIAVIGASERPGSVGRVLLDNARSSEPLVSVYAVNPAHTELMGGLCVASIADIDADVGLAIVAVPEAALAEVLSACARHRVRGAVVITEVSETFAMSEVVADARRYGMRIVGPGSMGLAMPRSSPALHAHLAHPAIPAGPLAVSLQSGSIGASVLDRAVRLGVGISSFVSLGDKSDVSANDLLQFWEDDESTRVIAMYTESFGNPRRFARIARRVSQTRPIVAVRPGAGPVDDALYQQAGVIRVETVADLLDTARVLASQPVALGRRVAIVSNSSGPARLLSAGLDLVGLQGVGPNETVGTWYSLPWSAEPKAFAAAVDAVRSDGTCDAAVVIHAPPVAPTDDVFARELAALLSNHPTVPLIAVLLGRPDGTIVAGSTVPNFAFPDDVARVLARCNRYARWRAALDVENAVHDPHDVHLDDDRAARADAVIAEALVRRPLGTLLPHAPTIDLLEAYDIPCAPTRPVVSVEAAVNAATELGFPVALKANVRPRRGRGADAGVALGLADVDALHAAWAAMDDVVGGLREATVQVLVPSGIECRIHATIHPVLGPVVSVGLGGVFADAIGDSIVRLVPIGIDEAVTMLGESRAGRVIDGLGDGATAATAQVIAAVAAAIDRHPELAEIDLNPLIVADEGCWVVDALVRVRPTLIPDAPLRRLN